MIETKLWAHQQKAVDLAKLKPNIALFLEIGTGKTATLINILRHDYAGHGVVRNTLIFAPLSVCPQWKKEFAKWSKIPEKCIHVLTGDGAKRVRALEAILRFGAPAIIVTNYEAVRIKNFYELLLKWSPHIVVLDESHKVKDPSSLQSKAIYPLCHAADRRFILTGTPILNSMLDIFGQYKALDPAIFGSNFWKFKALYFYDKNAGRPNCNFPDWQPRPESAKLISECIASTSVQAKKADCLDLPPLLRVPISVPLSEQQRKAYEDMKKHYVTEMKGVTAIAEFAMTKTLRMQQILAGFIAEDSDSEPVWCDENPRLDCLKDILDQIGGEKTIIWTTFRPTYMKIAKVCEKSGYKYAFLTGDQSAKQKEESIEAFCRGDVQALIANPAAGGAGINLQEAKYAIYFTRGYSLEHYLQSEGRNYRGGSEMHDKITHFHLIADDTLDEVIATALLNKQNIGETVLDWARKVSET